jgi:single-stranded DNA-binding protein
MSINQVTLTGVVEEPGARLLQTASGKAETKFTLAVSDGKGDQMFTLHIPVFVYGANAERAAHELNSGDTVAIGGRVSWKSLLKKDGTKLGLCVSTFAVDVLVKSTATNGAARQLPLMAD